LLIFYDGKQPSYFPNVVPLTKNATTLNRLKLDVLGTLTYGCLNDFKKLYLSLPFYSHDSNLSLSIIMDSIINALSKCSVVRPHTLYIQTDNASKEAKNKHFFILMSHLIKYNWFKEIYLNCLPPGHTHGEIDREFSKWAINEPSKSFYDSSSLDTFICQAWKADKGINKNKIRWCWLTKVYDWKKLFKESQVNLSGYSKARVLRFKKNKTGEVIMKYKCKEGEIQWLGREEEEGKKHKGIVVCQSYVSCSPEEVKPNNLDMEIIEGIRKHPLYENKIQKSVLSAEFWKDLKTLGSSEFLQKLKYTSDLNGNNYFIFLLV